MIKNSVGTNMFRNFYLRKGKKIIDDTEDGNLSCGFYVSSILLIFGLIKTIDLSVAGTVQKMERAGWKKIKMPRRGAVLVWESKKSPPSFKPHRHIGFYVGTGRAISNNSKYGVPKPHHYTFNGKRKIEAIYWYKKFEH